MKRNLKAAGSVGLALGLAAFSASAQLIGPSTSVAPYIEAMTTNVTFTSILSVGDSVNLKPDGVTPYRMVGIPDGLGAYDNCDGTFTLLMNHELTAANGVARAHGGKGAFVSKWIIDKATLKVLNGSDLMTSVYLWNTNASSYYLSNNVVFARFCSADLPAVSAFYNPATGNGTTNRIFMDGEESAPANARAMAHVATGPFTGTSWELPWLGKMNWENALACPVTQDKTIVACDDDSGVTDSLVFMYIGTKTSSGLDVEMAGLTNGHLFVVSVSGMSSETSGTTAATRNFSLVDINVLTNVTALNSTTLKAAGIGNGGSTFMRVEDGAWDPTHTNDYYFVTTAAPLPQPSRLWRLRFTNIAQPELGGVIDMMLDGTEGQFMMDNICADISGNILINEDPGNQARLSRVWKYYPSTDAMIPIGVAKSNLFASGGANFLTQDEEWSGIVDVGAILGAGRYLFVCQVHTNHLNDSELVEGGQLLLLQTAQGATAPSTLVGPYIEPMQTNVTFTSILSVGDSVNLKPDGVTPYRMVGIPDGLGAFDNCDGTFTLLMNHELTAPVGVARAHGGKGAFVSKWIIDKATLRVLNGSDLMTSVYLWSTNATAYFLSNNVVFARFCSADLPPVSAFYNPATGNGTSNRIFMNGEESAPANARAMAHIVTGPDASTSWELPWLGKMNWENALACPVPQDKTIVACNDDDGLTDSQVYFYIGTKTSSGIDVVKAGLTGGRLYGVSVSGLSVETSATTAITRNFSLVDLSAFADVTTLTADRLEQVGNTNAVTAFMRSEDGAWDPTHTNDYYFVTTASPTLPSRLWRLRFTNIAQPELGGVIDMMLNGTEGQFMLDNIGFDASGNLVLNEDPGGNARLSRVWKYYPATDAFVPLGVAKSNFFSTGGANFLTIDEEWSGIIDVSGILGAGRYLFVGQVHTNHLNDSELVEGGQLLLMETVFTPLSISGQPQSANISPGGSATFTVTVPPGSWVQWYFNGIPIGGANGASLVINSVNASSVGSYYAVVGNGSGSQVSSVVTLSTTSIALYAGITINGPIGSSFKIQYTTDLAAVPIVWTDLITVTLSTSSETYVDSTPANQAKRFYRAVPQP